MSDIVKALHDAHQQLISPGSPYEIVEREFGDQRFRCFAGAPESLRELLDAGRQHGEQPFTHYLGDELSYREFFQRVDALGYQLIHQLDISAEDRIAIAMRNRPEWLEAYAAAVSLAAVVVPLNSWGTAEELAYGLEDSQARLVICDPQRAALIKPTANLRVLVVDEHRPDHPKQGESEYEQLLGAALGQAMPDTGPVDPEAPIQIMYTSGTTGKPKGAVSSHRNICQALMAFEYHAYCSVMANPEAMNHMMNSGVAPCTLLSVPLFHVSGCYAAFLLTLRGGRRLVLSYKWDAEAVLQLIEQQKVTIFSAVPAMVIDLLQHPKFEDYDTSSLFSIGGGGGACPPLFKQAIDQRYSQSYIGTGYGMTESNAICSNCTGAAFNYKPTATGTLCPIVDFKTCDEQGNELPTNATGEIWLRSPTNIREYWHKPEASAELYRDGWMATGDTGYVDEEGFVFLVGRSKDVIIRGGENIYPAELEQLLSLHPKIKESAVFALPDPVLGEVPALVAELTPGSQIDQAEVASYIGQHLAAFKIPQQCWFVDQPLPRNATGKIMKKQLQEKYAAQQAL